MAIDHGETRVGIALSDPLRIIARPFRVIVHTNRKADLREIAAIVAEHNVARIVIGIPTGTDGKLTGQARKVIAWARKLAMAVSVPVVTWDESYTSVDAEALMQAKVRHPHKRRAIDDVAAAVLLQDYLNSGGTHGDPGQPLETLA